MHNKTNAAIKKCKQNYQINNKNIYLMWVRVCWAINIHI